ncbi:MAG: UdgX family uracil-DNA binding protein [Steroidobacteraceae bacterium]|nr:UdgX family uracil-DNA binding protein [Steroidobacteraceae bacterium]
MPPAAGIDALRAAAATCKGCELHARGTQTVFGQGARGAALMFVGEQPGDREDLAGRPFVGPAGQLLDAALARAGIERRAVYVTNAVKHFKWEPRGPRRIHQAPSAGEIAACRPWLEAEVRAIQPRVIVCLGVTAARAIFGRAVRLGDLRGGPHGDSPLGVPVFVTIHPSAILRLPERTLQDAELARLVEDLRAAARSVSPEAAPS